MSIGKTSFHFGRLYITYLIVFSILFPSFRVSNRQNGAISKITEAFYANRSSYSTQIYKNGHKNHEYTYKTYIQVELFKHDRRIKLSVQENLGDTTNVGWIRYVLRKTESQICLSSAGIARVRISKNTPYSTRPQWLPCYTFR